MVCAEKKTLGNWLGRQFSRQMSRGNELSDDGIERVTAVAAAVFAIHSVEESEIARPRKRSIVLKRRRSQRYGSSRKTIVLPLHVLHWNLKGFSNPSQVSIHVL